MIRVDSNFQNMLLDLYKISWIYKYLLIFYETVDKHRCARQGVEGSQHSSAAKFFVTIRQKYD